jgi:hypothetical protein
MSKTNRSASDKLVPDVEQILADPSASFWIKGALRSALERDPVDAANDADALAKALSRRCNRLLGTNHIGTNMDSIDFLSETLAMPSCHVCGAKMEPVCTRCGATTRVT